LDSIFKFSRDNVEQFLVLNLGSSQVDTKELEELIDERCKVHTELTVGTSEFIKKQVRQSIVNKWSPSPHRFIIYQCPFVQTYVPGKDRWPSMGEVVNFDPDMAQWVGDGELVGVRTKFLITLDDNVVQTPGYKSYFSPTFWRSVHQKDSNTVKSVEAFKERVHDLCKVPAGGIGLEAYIPSNK
jgi:hypothetical protein